MPRDDQPWLSLNLRAMTFFCARSQANESGIVMLLPLMKVILKQDRSDSEVISDLIVYSQRIGKSSYIGQAILSPTKLMKSSTK